MKNKPHTILNPDMETTLLVCLTNGDVDRNKELQTSVISKSGCRPIRWFDREPYKLVGLDWISIDLEGGCFDGGRWDSFGRFMTCNSRGVVLNCCKSTKPALNLLSLLHPKTVIKFSSKKEREFAINILKGRCVVKKLNQNSIEVPCGAKTCLYAHGVTWETAT